MNRQLVVIYATIAIDAAGIAILVPILPDLIRSLHGSGGVSVLYGSMLALYALMQFISAPAIGVLSDRFGRRPALLISLAGTVLNFLMVAFAPDVSWLFLSRAIAGLTSATPAIATACLADITPKSQRGGRFGISQACFGIGFALGPFIGGMLGDISLRHPCLVGGLLSGISFVAVLFFLPETHVAEKRAIDWRGLNPLVSLRWAFGTRTLFSLLIIFLLMSLVGQTYSTSWVLFVDDRFRWNSTQVGLSLGLFGALVALTQTFAVRPLIQRFGEYGTLFLGIGCEACALLILAFAPATWVAYAVIPLVALGGVGLPVLRSLQTQAVDAEHQGQLQGVAVSLTSLSAIFGSLVFGWIYALSLPGWNGLVWIAGVAIYALAVPLLLSMRPKNENAGS